MSLYIFDAMLLRFSLNGNNPRYFSSPCGILNLSMKEDKTDANFLPISIYKNMIYINCNWVDTLLQQHSTVLYTFTHKQYSTHIYTQTVQYSRIQYTFTHKRYSTHLHTKSRVQYSKHLQKNSTVQYTFTHKEYSTHLHTNGTVQYSTHLHTNSTVQYVQYTFTHKQ